jgi:hypothetical protein
MRGLWTRRRRRKETRLELRLSTDPDETRDGVREDQRRLVHSA